MISSEPGLIANPSTPGFLPVQAYAGWSRFAHPIPSQGQQASPTRSQFCRDRFAWAKRLSSVLVPPPSCWEDRLQVESWIWTVQEPSHHSSNRLLY